MRYGKSIRSSYSEVPTVPSFLDTPKPAATKELPWMQEPLLEPGAPQAA